MLILRAYKYLFYKLYCFERMLFDPTPGFTALGLIVVVQGMNIGLLWFDGEIMAITSKHFFGYQMPAPKEVDAVIRERFE